MMARLSSYIRREWLSLILGLILVLFALSLFAGPLGPRDLLSLRRHHKALEARREELLARNAALRTNVQKLTSDSRYLERLIRRELGYTRPNELIYKYADPDAAERTSHPAHERSPLAGGN
jgi:cell division protein FtsB